MRAARRVREAARGNGSIERRDRASGRLHHRLFAHITMNWRGRPLTSHEVIISTIAAVTTATGLTVTAMLDTGTYPGRVKISDKRMKDLEDRVLDRHAFRGEWNYTVRPAPAAPDPAPPPPGPDLAALAALAGVPDLAALLGAVAVPWQACREQRLHLARGGARRKQSGCGPRQLPFEAIVAAAACHIRLGMTYYLLSQLLGAHDSTISLAAGRITPLLEEHGITPQAGRTRISTLDQLREHAAAHGITITGITSQTPQEGAYQDDTPKTVN